ncbi:Arc family DNA-binding protein [Enterobacter hormaechei]|uniref:Arc family DNA-binding protein n=2 Tax=Enterobacter hormaechei TaxID=158836 RepID=A0A9X7Q6P9_9ENTR|nr:Arc family DNA-binding protein [Enterobacter hormaechei]QHO81882.1 Arc family DNA-binding protein [Enterobacter hormaechei]QHO99469.1 Arc family DNA-binding protein [Enterobacter hormaechei]
MKYYDIVPQSKEYHMKEPEVKACNNMLVRMPAEMKEKITEGAKRSFRSANNEVLYRLQLADEILSKATANA